MTKRLLPFIRSKHNISDVINWPDMAAIHYQSDVQEWLTSKGIDFVKKADNTPNCPQIRPTEKFWKLCKKDYSLMPTVCDSIEDMRKKWIKISENNSRMPGKTLMLGAPQGIAPGWKGRAVRTFQLLIRVQYIMVNGTL